MSRLSKLEPASSLPLAGAASEVVPASALEPEGMTAGVDVGSGDLGLPMFGSCDGFAVAAMEASVPVVTLARDVTLFSGLLFA